MVKAGNGDPGNDSPESPVGARDHIRGLAD